MIISDGGSNWDIVAGTDLTEDRSVEAAIAEIGLRRDLINSAPFEIDESSLMVDPYSSRVAYNNPYVTPAAFAIAKAARVLDISTSGMKLEVRNCLPVHPEVTVCFNSIIALGKIRYCRRNRNESFDLGLQLEEVINTV